jgi:hypothetical protein
MKKINCQYCGNFWGLGSAYAIHVRAHEKRRAEIKEIRARIDSGKYDSSDFARWDILKNREKEWCVSKQEKTEIDNL